MIHLRTLVAISFIAVAAFIGVLQIYHASREGPKRSPNGEAQANLKSTIETTAHRLQSSHSQETSYLTLLELETKLKELPPEEAETGIIDYLNTGQDAHTGLQFLLDADGWLETAPTLRVFLLDQLGVIHPESAATYSKTVLKQSSSPDEWAIALRNYARELKSPPREDAFLKGKLNELLTNKNWSEAPTLGYLQAYDLIVFYGGDTFIPELSKQIENKANPAAQYAARLTLDRLAIHDYTTTAQAMLNDMSALKSSPSIRARIFARADVRDTHQRALLETYLLEEELGARELNAFAQSFPNINLEISYNLVTQEKKAPLSLYAEQDQASLTMIEELIQENPLTETQSRALTTLKERLIAINQSIKHGKEQQPESPMPASL